ncbi:MAG: CPBP family intramembrane glutamic endopeptidase [Thermoanaerobaculia bacterium]
MSGAVIETSAGGAVASKSHTVGLLLAILAVSLWASMRSPIAEWPTTFASSHARLVAYVNIPLLPMLWIVYIWAGVRRATSIRSLIDEKHWTAGRWLRYFALGIGGWIMWLAIGAAFGAVLRPTPEQLRGLQAMLPHGAFERAVWVVCAPAAGICEELVYRGYLLRQFRALTDSAVAAVALQALAYGLAHLILPFPMLVPIAVLGLFLGSLTVWQKSLIPGMILHAGVALFAVAGAR